MSHDKELAMFEDYKIRRIFDEETETRLQEIIGRY